MEDRLASPPKQENVVSYDTKELTDEEKRIMQAQSSRLVSEHQAKMLEANAQKHWDLFYKRNDTRFFKDRHWTTREFVELLEQGGCGRRTLFEVGCGVGNLVYPLIEEKADFYYYACDLSPRAVEFVKSHQLYDEALMKVFQADITQEKVLGVIGESCVDVVSLVFVLSAVLPSKWARAVRTLVAVMRPGAVLLFRDYGRHDMAQLRFKPGNKIADNLYMRQDGTRSYFFALDELRSLLLSCGLEEVSLSYVQRRTLNLKENVDVPRTFIQAKFRKPQ